MFDPTILAMEDYAIACSYVGVSRLSHPDLVIAPDGKPYLYRWYLSPRAGTVGDPRGNCYFHIQVASDPERPLHDHPWDNMSVILSGGYDESVLTPLEAAARISPRIFGRRRGDVIFREAGTAHHLRLPEGVPYTMTQFTTGPNVKEWGFWIDGKWVDSHELIHDVDGVSAYTGPKR